MKLPCKTFALPPLHCFSGWQIRIAKCINIDWQPWFMTIAFCLFDSAHGEAYALLTEAAAAAAKVEHINGRNNHPVLLRRGIEMQFRVQLLLLPGCCSLIAMKWNFPFAIRWIGIKGNNVCKSTHSLLLDFHVNIWAMNNCYSEWTSVLLQVQVSNFRESPFTFSGFELFHLRQEILCSWPTHTNHMQSWPKLTRTLEGIWYRVQWMLKIQGVSLFILNSTPPLVVTLFSSSYSPVSSSIVLHWIHIQRNCRVEQPASLFP